MGVKSVSADGLGLEADQAFESLLDRKPLTQKGNSAALRSEIFEMVNSTAETVAEIIPETNYAGMTASSIILPPLLNHLHSFALPQSDQASPTWNYVDASLQGLTGLQQLFDKSTHRPYVTKTKGLFNLASSIQLITLTTLGSAALGPIGLAAATGTAFILSTDEAIRQIRRLWSPEYYFVDTLAELDKVEDLILGKQKTLADLDTLSEKDRNSRSGKLAIKLARSALTALKDRRDNLRQQLEVKLDAHRYEHRENPGQSSLHKIIEGYSKNRRLLKNNKCRDFLAKLHEREMPAEEQYQQVKAKDLGLRKQNERAVVDAVADSALWALAFTGVLLACIPGCQVVSFALILAASLLFAVKNKHKISAKVRQVSNFFKKEATTPDFEQKETGFELMPRKPSPPQEPEEVKTPKGH